MSGRVIGLGVLIALVPPPAGDAHACLLASPEPVVVDGEESLIVWDEARHREHFIRRADFRNATRPFGFVVPTPGRPSLREVDDAVFTRLAALYSAPLPRSGGGGNLRSRSASADGVVVVERTRVAGLDATVLRANDAGALARWLSDHGLPSPAGMEAWLAPYVARRFHVTAFHYDPGSAPAGSFGSRAVMMSFHTRQPFFPYSEPAGGEQPEGRRFRVSIVAGARMAAKVGARPWRARVGYAEQTERVRPILPRSIPAGIFPAAPWVTTFDETSSRRGTDDLTFEPAPDQTRVPPSIRERIAH